MQAQISANNIAEFQIGKSNYNPESRNGWYDQFNIHYSSGLFSYGLRFENYTSSDDRDGYSSMSQRFVELRNSALRIRVGNFYNMFGNGISQRSFDLPGVILEDLGSLSRFTPTRDLNGLLLEYTYSSYKLSLIKGTPVESTRSPSNNFDLFTQTDRRSGTVEGGEIKSNLFNFINIGSSYLHIIPDKGAENEIYSFTANLNSNLFRKLLEIDELYIDVEGEISNRDRNIISDGISFSTDDPHAIYLAFNIDYKKLSLSTEYKDYVSYNIGVNDPPSLVKEHSYVLLNRDIHVLIPKDERGYQIELSYYHSPLSSVTANLSFARNNIFQYNTDFTERFIELSHQLSNSVKGTLYFANSKDEFNTISNRITFGGSWDYNLNNNTGTSFDIAIQNVERDFEFYLERDDDSRSLEISKYKNLYMSFSIGKSGLFTAGILTERSSDPLDTDKRSTFDIIETDPRWWTSLNLSFELGMKHQVRIFAGNRRGGPACTAGTCYELFPFEGLELTLTSRL